jgi:hypothetical protein
VAAAADMGGLGPLIAGLFAQYGPHPTVLVFQVYLAVLAAAGQCLFLVPETVSPADGRHPLRRTRHPRAGPERVRRRGVAAFAAFSLLGLFAGLAPTFVANMLHEPNHAVQGAVVFGLLAVGTVAQLVEPGSAAAGS